LGEDRLTRKFCGKEVHAAMPQYGTWVSYAGTARIVLAIVMVAAAGGVVYAGTLLTLRTFMLVIWGLGRQLRRPPAEGGSGRWPRHSVAPRLIESAGGRRRSWRW
jgi:hypothetical protein